MPARSKPKSTPKPPKAYQEFIKKYPELGQALLVCATEKRSPEEIQVYADKLARVIATRSQARCPVEPKFQ